MLVRTKIYYSVIIVGAHKRRRMKEEKRALELSIVIFIKELSY